MTAILKKIGLVLSGMLVYLIILNCDNYEKSGLPGNLNAVKSGKVIWGAAATTFPGEKSVNGIDAWMRLNDRIKTTNGGHGLSARRSYDREIPESFAASAMGPDIDLCPVSIGSFKPSWKETADGTNNEAILRFIKSIPDNHTVYLVFHHEPEDEAEKNTSDYNPELLQDAFARFVEIVVTSGKKNVHPCFVLMTWTFNPKSGRNPDDFNMAKRVKPEYLDKVIAGLDGYADVPSKGSARDIFESNLGWLVSWGFTRFGVFETATHSTENEAARVAWINGLGKWASERGNIELVSWFHSGVGQHAGPTGWYLGKWVVTDGKAEFTDPDGSVSAYGKLMIP